MRTFSDLKVGDEVTRLLCGTIPMPMRVCRVTEDRIFCNAIGCDPETEWEFNRSNGAEVDLELGFDGVTLTASILKL